MIGKGGRKEKLSGKTGRSERRKEGKFVGRKEGVEGGRKGNIDLSLNIYLTLFELLYLYIDQWTPS